MCSTIKPSFIPPADIREIRDIVRYHFKLTNIITGENNRAHNCLTVSNLKLDDVFSNIFGKSSLSITEYMLAHPEFRDRYRRIKAHRGHKKAIIAICRMLLTAIWHILTDKKPYTADGFTISTPVREKTILTRSQALYLLRQKGSVIKDDEPQTAS